MPRQLEANGLKASQIEFADPALTAIIEEYTREAGVRNLEREIGTVSRKVAREVAEGKGKGKVADLGQAGPRAARQAALLLGDAPPHQGPRRRDRPRLDAGRRRGPVHRGDADAGQGQHDVTGQLGDVMRESAQAALSSCARHARARPRRRRLFAKHDIHIHVPAGAVPKDGPSAGVAMVTALASLI